MWPCFLPNWIGLQYIISHWKQTGSSSYVPRLYEKSISSINTPSDTKFFRGKLIKIEKSKLLFQMAENDRNPQPLMSSSPPSKPLVSSFPNNIEGFKAWLKVEADPIVARVTRPPLLPPQPNPPFTWLNPRHLSLTQRPRSLMFSSPPPIPPISSFPNNI